MASQLLRKYLHEETKRLSGDAVEKLGTVPDKQIEKLQRLAQLSELYERTKPQPKPARWPVITVLALVGFFIGLSLWLKIPSTEVELDLHLSDVQFTLPREAVLTRVMVLKEAGISDLKEVQLPRARTLKARSEQTRALSLQQSSGGVAVQLSSVAHESTPGVVTLSPLILPGGTRVELSESGLDNLFRVELTFPDHDIPTLQVSVKGTVKITISGAPPQENTYPFPQSIQLQPATNRVVLALTLAEEMQNTFASHTPASDLSFLRFEKIGSYDREVSSVLGGKLYLTDISNQEHPLRIGEYLFMQRTEGLIRLLQFETDRISLQYHGATHGLTSGWERDSKENNLMPNYLEWIRMQRTLVLLWSSTISVFVFLLGLWRWWKKTE